MQRRYRKDRRTKCFKVVSVQLGVVKAAKRVKAAEGGQFSEVSKGGKGTKTRGGNMVITYRVKAWDWKAGLVGWWLRGFWGGRQREHEDVMVNEKAQKKKTLETMGLTS